MSRGNNNIEDDRNLHARELSEDASIAVESEL